MHETLDGKIIHIQLKKTRISYMEKKNMHDSTCIFILLEMFQLHELENLNRWYIRMLCT